MKPLARLAIAAGLLLAQGSLAQDGSATTRLQASLDGALDWANPLALTVEKLEAAFPKGNFRSSPYFSLSDDKDTARMGRKPFRNVEVDLSFLGSAAKVETGLVKFREGGAESIEITLAEGSPSALAAALSERLKTQPATRSFPSAASPRCTFSTWTGAGFVVILADQTEAADVIHIVRPEGAASRYSFEDAGKFTFSCDLDFLLDLPAAWQTNAAALDARFPASGTGMKKSPFFEWLTADKTRARFSRAPFSNVEVDLRLFAGQVKVEEAIIDYKDGRPTLVSISLYNRGDSGQMGSAEFEALFKSCGQRLGQILKVAPRQQKPIPGKAVKSVSWLWPSPAGNALLEYAEYGKRGREVVPPEFLRVKLGPPGRLDWNFNEMPSGLLTSRVTKADLARNVAKTAEGDVYIKGVPMVDQGAKGYCVAASCQRLFEYYQLPADQHEFAQLFGTTATGGTSSREMEEALDKVDNRFKTRFKALYSRYAYSADRRKNGTLTDLTKMVKEHVDAGIPLLWTLVIGLVSEDPPLAPPSPDGNGQGAAQTTGGHMRMIIGYNVAKQQIIFSDSWGAGHEIKRMDASNATRVTDGVYLLEPRK